MFIDSTDWLLGMCCCAGAAVRYCLERYSSLLKVNSSAVLNRGCTGRYILFSLRLVECLIILFVCHTGTVNVLFVMCIASIL